MDDAFRVLDSSGKKILFILGTIVVIGMTMVLSASYIYAGEIYNDSFYFFKRQAIYLLFGLVVALTVGFTKCEFWFKFSFLIHIVVTFFLLLTLVPSIGIEAKGASRWFQIAGVNFQPGEMIKYTILFASFYFFDSFNQMQNRERVIRGFFLLIPLIFLIKQPDFGTFTICLIAMVFACFMSTFSRKIFYLSLPVLTMISLTLLISQPYRVRRLLTFLDPWENPLGSGFQIIQSLYGFANGSWFGKGLGNSNEKLFYLPEAHNDFIFSVLGEELGFLGVFVVAFLFLGFIYYGMTLAVAMKDRISSMLTLMVVFIIGLQAFLNMGVVLGLLPTKGMNLPFISYGGSSLVANFFAIGLILSAWRGCRNRVDTQKRDGAQSFDSQSFATRDQSVYEKKPRFHF